MLYAHLLEGTSARTAVPSDLSLGAFRQYLEALPANNPQEALRCASDQFHAMNQGRMEWRLRSDLAEAFRQRAEELLPTLESEFSEVALPLSASRRTAARIAQQTLAALGSAYKSALADLARELPSSAQTEHQLTPLVHGMRTLARLLVISHRIYAPYPAGAWHELHSLFALATRQGISEMPIPGGKWTALAVYRNALLLAFAEPLTLMQRDVERLLGYLSQFGERAVLGRRQQGASGPGMFVIRADRDAPGCALEKDSPEATTRNDVILNCRPLVETLLRQLEQGNSGAQASAPRLSASMDETVSRDLMQRLVRHWGHVESRQFDRLRADSRVELLVGLRAIWNFLLGGGQAGVAREGRSEWTLTNESAGGFALRHASGRCAPIRVGEVVAIRTQEHCHICVVRWARSSGPEDLELGVQGLAPTATPVALGNGDTPAGEPALLLPEVPALRRGATILAPFGRVGAKNEYRLDHCGLQWRVYATRLLDQTQSVQLFGFSPAVGSRS